MLLKHAERELSRDRSQHLASELLANLPTPDGQSVAHTAADYLEQLPEPVGRRAHTGLEGDRGAGVPDPDSDLAGRAADITARLDELERDPPEVDDGLGLDLW